MIYSLYYSQPPMPDMDWFDPKQPVAGPRRVNRKKVAKARARNKAARKSRRGAR